MNTYKFPDGFLWGAATSAYQIEGGASADGRGESIWDRFCRRPGAIRDGSTGDVACDHYHRWRDDVELMSALNLNSYRFSIAWPRIFPEGRGELNEAGLAFYDRLVDQLLERGIRPLPTLYHWDLPAALQDEGGWARRETAYRFRDYAEAVFRRLGDRVKWWVTINEPWVAAMLGHFFGWHAPGSQDAKTALQAAHHLLLAHGLAVEAFEELGLRGSRGDEAHPGGRGGEGHPGGLGGGGPEPLRGCIGAALDINAHVPASDEVRDREAAERAKALEVRWFLEPLCGRGYPADAWAWYERQGVSPVVEPGDMERIGRPADFLGINYYRRHVIAADESVPLLGYRQVVPGDLPVTGMQWEVFPEGLYDVLTWAWRTHLEPAGVRFVLVTENGAAYPDALTSGPSGPSVHDPARTAYLQAHVHHLWRAVRDGVPVRGYYVWSLLDNFEWAHGYTQRFGIVYVDFATQQRIVKDSGRWFARVAGRNALDDAPGETGCEDG